MDSIPARNGDPFVSLTSKSVVNQFAFANNCGIPLGVLVNCISPEELPCPEIGHNPSRCRNCGAFLNPWCTVGVASKAGQWKCCFCDYTNEGPPGLDMTFTEANYDAVTYRHQPPVAAPPADTDAAAGEQQPSSSPEAAAPAALTPVAPHIALLFDTTLDDVSMTNAQSAAKRLLQALPPTTKLSLITYGASVSVFDLAAETATACVLPGHTAPDKVQLKQALEGMGRAAAPLSDCSTSVDTVLDSLRPHAASVPLLERKRCMGTAVEVALRVIATHQSTQGPVWHTDRVVVIAGGSPTYGPGALPVDMVDAHTASSADGAMWKEAMGHFSRLGHLAAGRAISIDIFAPQTTTFNVPLCLEMVHPCGGELVLHHRLGPLFHLCLLAALHRKFGNSGVMDLFVSPDLRVSQVMGSVGPLSEERRVMYSPNACSVSSLESGRGIGICLEVLKDLSVERLFMQVVLQWADNAGQIFTRVVTSVLRVVPTSAEYVAGVNPAVAGTLLAKRLVLEGHKAGAAFNRSKMEELRVACAAQLAHMTRRFGTAKVSRGGFLGFGSKQVYLWPSQLMPLAIALYQLQRSPLLLHSLCPPATRMLLTKLFLRGSFSSAEHLVHPRLYQYSPNDHTFREIPPVSIALDPHSILLLDSGPTFFLFLGSQASLDTHQASTATTATTAAATTAAPTTALPNGSSATTAQHDSPAQHDGTGANGTAPAAAANGHPHSPRPHGTPLDTPPPAAPHTTSPLPNGSTSGTSGTSGTSAVSHAMVRNPSRLPPQLLADFEAFAGELAWGRFPVPDTHVVYHGEHELLPLLVRLVPAHLDGEEEQRLQWPHGEGEVRGVEELADLPAAASGPSFVGWCREQGLQVLG